MQSSTISIDYRHLDRIQIVALFAAFSFFLSSIEYLLPRPIPFFRYGLANIAILLALREFKYGDLFLLSLLKVIGLGILNGTFASYVFVFSFFGTMGSLLCMWGLKRIVGNYVSLIGISVAGAFISNSIQILCAVVYVFGKQSWVIAPYLLLLGMFSGVLIGIFAQYYWNKSTVLHQIFVCYRNVSEKYKKDESYHAG